MLAYLRIRGLALLDDVTLEFSAGMTVLTGETGAGKSIIVGALSLLRGARANSDLVRAGQDTAVIDARFDPKPEAWPRLKALADELGIDLGDLADGLIVRRTIAKSGRSRSFIQDAPTTQGALATLGQQLVDICGQHEHHFLTHAGHHLEVLDACAGAETLLGKYRVAYVGWREAQTELSELQARTTDRVQRADYLRFQVEELERVSPQPGEQEALQRRHVLLKDTQQWAEFADEARHELYEADGAIAGRLAAMAARAVCGAEQSPALAELAEHLTAAQLSCEEAAHAASQLGDELNVEPGELETVAERLHELLSLRRKHGVDADALVQRLSQMQHEILALEHSEQRQREAVDRERDSRAQCCRVGKKLHDKRAAAAQGLCDAVVSELSALHLASARLSIEVVAESLDEPGPQGIDRAEFLFSANPGEPLAPLSRVASGGELSRVLLAIKGALAADDRVATYVFDEVDAGVGGRVAEAIGRRLQAAAATHQVLCVTHLPQIAAFAASHIRVEKATKNGRTTTRVVSLEFDDRAPELARMLGGAKTSATQHAERLLVDAKKRRAPARSPVTRSRARARSRAGARA
ncbi:MAG: DNA repair protein RecN [Nannocystaceae bacterium]|nr:DNA repair protein RecN [Nannocystaceae bacterium]